MDSGSVLLYSATHQSIISTIQQYSNMQLCERTGLLSVRVTVLLIHYCKTADVIFISIDTIHVAL